MPPQSNQQPVIANDALAACQRCARLCDQFKGLRDRYPDYWNQPVPASGPVTAPLLIVGLAPGLHGANRTGEPFQGDASGDLLWATLDHFGLTHQVRITNAVKCLPPQNRPSADELGNCRDYLQNDLVVSQAQVILALGRVAHTAVLRALGERVAAYPFGHGARFTLADGRVLIDSYHCSRYNTQTGRLTPTMFRAVFRSITRVLDT